MSKTEELEKIIGIPANIIEEQFDHGILDILLELNRKGYYTIFSCEGHCDPNPDKKGNVGHWEGYLAFNDTYRFEEYPPKFYKYNNHRRFFYWNGYGEESRLKYLEDVLRWARTLPTREKKKVVVYHLLGKNKKHPNREPKLFYYGEDYEEVRCIMNRSDIDNYYDFQLMENIRYI